MAYSWFEQSPSGLQARDPARPLTAPWRGARIATPTLFMAGTEEPFFQMAAGKAAFDTLEQTVPGLRQKACIEGAGHWLQQEQPDE